MKCLRVLRGGAVVVCVGEPEDVDEVGWVDSLVFVGGPGLFVSINFGFQANRGTESWKC